jgi:flavin-dependent dehydrogenase
MWLGHRVAPWGYAWAFPSTENGLPHVRVGIGTPRAVPDSAGIWFTRFLAAHPEYAGSVHHRVGGIIPTAPVSKVLQRDGLVLLGDAARLCCPLTGGGILGALASGDAAAHAVVEDAPETYPDKIGWLVRELRTRWMLKQIVYGLNDAELGRLVRFLGDIDLPSDGSVNPLRERRRVTRKLIRSDPGIVLSLFTRGRLMRALLPAG